MPSFHPYTIHHLQLDGRMLAEAVNLPVGNHYLVFWRDRIPMGHLWLELDKEPADLRQGLYREAITAAIRPALEYYEAAVGRGDGVGERNDQEGTRDDGMGEYDDGAKGRLSVIICTRNRPKELERCVETLLHSSDTDFELIVVDNAPDDEQTADILRRFPMVRYIKEERKGLDIARNTGARAASYPLIAYTDDDVLVDKNWTRQLKTCFSDPLVMAVTGLVIPESLQTRSQYIFERYWGFNKGYLPKTFDHRYFLDHLPYGVPAWDIGAGANMAFRREVFDLAGWFDERLDVGASGCSGDSEFWYRILAEGWNCLYLPAVFVYHRHRDSDAGLKKQLFYYMRGHVSALLVQYERYRHKGNYKRLFTGLPLYYWKRIKGRINFDTLFTEIKGCLSGWQFYRSAEKPTPVPILLPANDVLRQNVILNADTLVSVIIPSHNHARYLGAAIQTVLDQTYQNIEIIVVDDGSTDDTAALCRQYEKHPGSSGKLRYLRVERVGPSAARNIGVACSKGDFLVFLDADDLLYPNAVELNLYYFGLYPAVAFVSGGHDRIDDEGNYLPGREAVVRAGDNYRSLLQGNYIGMEATVLYRRALFPRWHFDPSVKTCEDYDLNLRITRHLPAFGHTTNVAAYRIHEGNRSKNRKMMLDSALSVLKEQEGGLLNEEEREAYRLGVQNWRNYYA